MSVHVNRFHFSFSEIFLNEINIWENKTNGDNWQQLHG